MKEVSRFGDEGTLDFEGGTGKKKKSVVVVEVSAKKEERLADYTPKRES
jgi:hypothetical protein